MFYGAGAGGDPTATAVVGDLVSVARNLLQGARGPGSASTNARRVRPMDDTRDQYYLKLRVDDRPGVLAEIADRFGRNGISLERVWQEGSGDEATLSFITHRAQEGVVPEDDAGAPRARRGPRRRERHPGGGRGVTSPDAAGPARRSGAASSRSTGLGCRSRPTRPWSRSVKEGRRSSGPRPLSAETGCDVWLKYDGANPTGSFKDRGMTLAISKALEEGAKAVVCASTGNTSASAAAYAAKAGSDLRGAGPEGEDRARQDGSDARARRAGARGRRQLRRLARAGEGSRGPVSRDAREQREPLPPRGTEDRRVRDLRRARAARPTCTSFPVGQRREHLEPLARLHRVPRGGHDPRAAAAVRLPGAGRGADRARPAGEGPADDRDRDPDREPGVVGEGGRRPRRSPRARSSR